MIKTLGIIGLGSIGQRHLLVAKKLWPSINIVAIRSGFGRKFNNHDLIHSIFYSLEEAIDNGIDAAIIATPAVYHVQQANKLISKGIPVLIEKPLSHTLKNVNKLIALKKNMNWLGF